MKRLICFDLDGTLTQHRSPLEAESRALLDALSEKYKLVMVGAGAAERIYRQMGEYPIDIIANYGMEQAVVEGGALRIIRRTQSKPDRADFLKKAAYLREKYGYTDYRGESVEFHPSGMVTFSLLGSQALVSDKLVFDPSRERRRLLYPEVLKLFPDYTVYIGGSSSFDFTEKQYNKYDAIMRYAEENGYGRDEILYVGDDFGVGGGDSHVRLGGLDYVEITDYRTTPERLRFLL